jgi:hypothetical protein
MREVDPNEHGHCLFNFWMTISSKIQEFQKIVKQ